MSAPLSPCLTDSAAEMTAGKAVTGDVSKSASRTPSFTAVNTPVADDEAAPKVPVSAGDGETSRKRIKVSAKTLERNEDGVIVAVKQCSNSIASDVSSLSSAPSDKEMVDADESGEGAADEANDADAPAVMSFEEKIAAATEKAKQATPQKKKASLKHRLTPPASSSSSKKARSNAARDRCVEASLKVQKLPYQSIISINMPPRIDHVPGEPFPEPEEDNLPFGDTENYGNSMIIHYMDELELTYTKAAQVYTDKFPHDMITDEAVRKRHIRSLLRLKQKYGLRDPADIPRPSKNVIRRGTPRAKKISSIVPVSASAAASIAPTPSTSFTSSDPQVPRRPRDRRLFEKTLIVTWHDAGEKLSFKDIQTKLEDEFDWSLGKGTIEKYYYTALERVYGKGGKKEKNKEERDGEAEDVLRDGDYRGFVERVVERRMSI